MLRHTPDKAKDATRSLLIVISVDPTRTVPNYSFGDVPISQVSDSCIAGSTAGL